MAAVTGDEWTELDVTDDLEWEREYGDRVPVVLLDGKEHGYWRVEEERLLRDLSAPRELLTGAAARIGRGPCPGE